MARWLFKLFSRRADRTGGSARHSSRFVFGTIVHDLVKTLRSMAADSPARQSRLKQIAKNYAQGTYRVDAQATAAKIIDDAFV
jgi:anti-sigma28 factor (negative regulator of flagellin synthesis)